MIKKIILLIVLLALASVVFSLAKSLRPTPQGKLPADSTPVGQPSLIEDQTWVWTETIMNNDTSVMPKKVGSFNITLSKGKITGKTDCNSFFGDYQIGSDGVITFGPLASTKMFCEGSQESVFTDFISKTTRYTLSPDGDLVLLLGMDSGSVMFKKNPEITLGIGQSGSVDDLKITFNKFLQDSRCPSDVECIQAGAVNINVTFSVGSSTVTRNMPSDEVPQVFEGHKISIVGIEPARHSKQEIKPEEYKITFHVEHV